MWANNFKAASVFGCAVGRERVKVAGNSALNYPSEQYVASRKAGSSISMWDASNVFLGSGQSWGPFVWESNKIYFNCNRGLGEGKFCASLACYCVELLMIFVFD